MTVLIVVVVLLLVGVNVVDKGLGDTISSVIKTVSRGKIKECGGCKKRKQWLNENVSYKKVNNLLNDLMSREVNNI